LAEGVLEEAAKMWKKESTIVIVDGDSDALKNILRSLESCMVGGKVQTGKTGLSRQGSFAFTDSQSPIDVDARRPNLDTHNSFGISGLEVQENEDDEENKLKDPREWIKVVSAFDQPRLTYSIQKKNFDKYVPHVLLRPGTHMIQKHHEAFITTSTDAQGRVLPATIPYCPPAYPTK
jgi:DNA polymerase epsilon subunit 2